ncbi:MAG TPA: AAA family ATPase [Syntrophales bacterium]|nr:AAA family ATPase [Syntrophales bacterium]
MRILSVRFRNLNSLTGEWHIDFTHPDYESHGVFAITGPTGSGKTTILDALCLGLYGRTPRLDRVTKSANDLMSRQTGDCFSEVTFETRRGRYRCHWSQHRARRRPDGELQQSRHEIADAVTGKVLESRIAEVGAFIEKVTGMNFDRFTRSMLLAQGGFAVFLQASPGERAPILEQITGTEIYSRISMAVHRRRGEEQENLKLLQAETRGISILEEEEEKALEASLMTLQSREGGLAEARDTLRKAQAWLDTLAALEKEIGGLVSRAEALEERDRAFGPAREKLARARKALACEGTYGTVRALRAEQARDMAELESASSSFPETEIARQEALSARQAALARLGEERARLASQGEIIRRVRDLDARLGERKRQLDETGRAVLDLEKQEKAYGQHIRTGEKALKDSLAVLEGLAEYLATHGADAALSSRLPLIGRGVAYLRDRDDALKKARESSRAEAASKAAASGACSRAEKDHEKNDRAWEETRRETESIASDLAAVLRGREPDEWFRGQERLRERERLIMEAGETAEGIEKTAAAVKDLETSLETLEGEDRELAAEQARLSGRKESLEKEAAALEDRVAHLRRVRDLEEERNRLEDGRPCPLCGATEHPYGKGLVPALDREEADLKKARNALKEASETLGRLGSRREGVAADLRHSRREQALKTEGLEKEGERLAAVLSRLEMEAPPDDRAKKLDEALAVVRSALAETSNVLARAEEKGKKERAARIKLEKLRGAVEESARALQEARHRLEKATLDEARGLREAAALADGVEKARQAVLKDMEPFGVDGATPADLDAVLGDLAAREAAWRGKEEEKARQEKRVADEKADLEKSRTRLAGLEEELTARRKERGALHDAHEALVAERRDLFGDNRPDDEEKRLAAAVEKAGEGLEKTRETLEGIEKKKASLESMIAALKGKTEYRAKELAAAEGVFTERIEAAGFAGEADFLSSRLDEDERKALEEQEAALVREKTEIDIARKERHGALAAERAKKLTDMTVEDVRDRLESCESELRQAGLDIGGIRKSLLDNAANREKKRAFLEKVEGARKECARWDDLHSLIGSADGRKFRNFAQGLTFEMMIAHANRELMKMTDRYLLIRDPAQPLELSVVDNYQAGEIRSTRNLSGGESFLASLALALGLSFMASRNVPVDSLFLDEGFGTLDDDALETALEALMGLRREGKLIGIISHVPAVRERIGTQIRVIPGAGGRSVLSGPGCRKI